MTRKLTLECSTCRQRFANTNQVYRHMENNPEHDVDLIELCYFCNRNEYGNKCGNKSKARTMKCDMCDGYLELPPTSIRKLIGWKKRSGGIRIPIYSEGVRETK